MTAGAWLSLARWVRKAVPELGVPAVFRVIRSIHSGDENLGARSLLARWMAGILTFDGDSFGGYSVMADVVKNQPIGGQVQAAVCHNSR